MILFIIILFLFNEQVFGQWQQFQADSARTGRVDECPEPPYRARWIFTTNQQILKNKDSEQGWTDDLTSRSNYTFPINTNFSDLIGGGVQPIIAYNKLYFGTMNGNLFCLNTYDGSLIWKDSISGGINNSAACSDSLVIFASLSGEIKCFNVFDGTLNWTYNTGYSISSSPLIALSKLFVGNHNGDVYCFDIFSGTILWKKSLANPVLGGLASDGISIFVGDESTIIYSLDIMDGGINSSKQLRGQGFRFLHPVVANDRVFVQTCPFPAVGSEYIMETLMEDSETLEEETSNIKMWLNGNTRNGRWSDASKDWATFYMFDRDSFYLKSIVGTGPTNGVGFPPNPPCLDNEGRALSWWKTRFPTLTKLGGTFGTNYSLDISGINPLNGERILIDNDKFSNMFPGPETDNLYSLSVGGDWLFLRQSFRGTQMINLKNSSHNFIACEIRNRDGGNFLANVIYFDNLQTYYKYPFSPLQGQVTPAISPDKIFIAEYFGIVCIESDN